MEFKNLEWLLWPLLAYGLGGIPTAIWYSKVVFGKDVRTLGSNNAGATNMMRNFGKKAGVIVLLIDILKGFLALFIPLFFYKNQLPDGMGPVLVLICGLGHVYPVLAGFKGGKGVATFLGAMLALSPAIAGLSIIHFFLWMVLFRYVSLASMLSGFFFAFIFYYATPEDLELDRILVWILPLVLVWTHRSNVSRLLKGNENRWGKRGR
jgi:acyl phosphate:glycerol-3-phosphate acyltransferase